MKNSYFLLHLAVFLAGFTGVFGKLITLNEGLLTFYRVLFSAMILFILTRILKIGSDTTNSEKKSIGKVGILITVHWVFFYASIKYSNISIGVICYCLTSFFTAIFKPLIDKTNFKFTELVLSTLTLAGISLIFHFDASYQLGIILGVISSAFAALYTIYNERLFQFYDSRLINYYQMVSGSIFLLVLLPAYLYFFPVETIFPNLSNTIYLILLALFCTVGLYVLFAEVLKKIPAFTVNLTFNLEPIYAIVIAFLFFNESKSVNASFYIGILFIISSVALQSYASSKANSK
ncbi:DMT family transporter [Flavobacterium sp. KACC 22761]|uniref:DMT family transporter n=1 Tax=Flavobacterium sp. KACC 22761 TaxID=3092665 RepID=UPI002A748830|nr:DMT family transporter [Flavobacterium sp. KACC 22761]WPO78876.1 DMT family transporter [Flavobacterium sp. KACC 22761]